MELGVVSLAISENLPSGHSWAHSTEMPHSTVARVVVGQAAGLSAKCSPVFTSAGRLCSKASNVDWIDTPPISELDIVKCVHSASGRACNIMYMYCPCWIEYRSWYFITKFTLIQDLNIASWDYIPFLSALADPIERAKLFINIDEAILAARFIARSNSFPINFPARLTGRNHLS